MKKIVYSLLFCLILLGSCQKQDFEGERVDERLNKTLTDYYETLSGSDNGWIAYFFTKGGAGYTFKMKFDKSNRVNMWADFNSESATTAFNSSYRLRATQLPSLYFDTYSYLHVLADPNPAVNGGPAGKGLESDFEFSIRKLTSDTIELVGNMNGSKMTLIRAGATDDDSFMQRVYNFATTKIAKLQTFKNYYKFLQVAGHQFQLHIDTDWKLIRLKGVGDMDTVDLTTNYVLGSDKLVLKDPLMVDGRSYREITQFNIDAEAGIANFYFEGQTASISNGVEPKVVRRDEALTMYSISYGYTTQTGFYKEGVSDAYGLQQIPGFVALEFTPKRYTNADSFRMYFDGAQNYVGPAVTTQIDSQNRILFTFLGWDANVSSVSAEFETKLVQFRQLITKPTGFYVFHLSNQTYDLVAVDDPSLWIRFN